MAIKYRPTLSMVCALLALCSAASFAGDNFTPQQQKQIETIVHNYLIQHPDVLIQMSQALQTQQVQQFAALEKEAQKVIPTLAVPLFDSKTSPVSGNPASPVTLIEFFDYQCPHCKEMAGVIDTVLKQDPNVKVVYKQLPLFGDVSVTAAKAALAANLQGKYQAFHDALLKTPSPLTNEMIYKIATNNGIDVVKLKNDMKSPTILNEIKQNQMMAKKLKLRGTPSFIVANVQNPKNITAVLIPGTASAQTLEEVIAKIQQQNA